MVAFISAYYREDPIQLLKPNGDVMFLQTSKLREMVVHVNCWNEARKIEDLKFIDLDGFRMNGLDGQRLNLSNSSMFNAEMENCDLRGADFSDSNLSGSSFQESDLTGADFSGSCMEKTTLQDCILRGADFSGAVMIDVDLEGADLSGADLTGAYLDGADLYNAVLDDIKGIEVPTVSSAHLANSFLEAINDGKVELDQGTWINEADCKTTLCLCGWAAIQEPELLERHGVQLIGHLMWPEARELFYSSSHENAFHFLREEASKLTAEERSKANGG